MTDQRQYEGREREASSTARGPATKRGSFSPQQRLLILDAWLRSKLPAREFSSIVGVSKHTLYVWKRQFEKDGPAGLSDQPRKKSGGSSRLPEATQRAILMMKEAHPDWGVDRIHAMLLRGEGYQASPGAIQRVLLADGYQLETTGTRPHAAPRTKRFERARPNQLWQSDLFTFTIKREGRRLYVVVFLDDYSRFVVSYAIHASPKSALVHEALESGISNYGPPEEVLTDNGPQYHSWRGKSALTKLLEKRGIRHIVSRPRHPQTLGKTERFWSTLWKELLEPTVIRTIEEARERVGFFVDYYNFQRTHQGIDNLVPADRFFSVESEVRRTIEKRVEDNALDCALHGKPRQPFYLTGRVGEQSISLHGEGGKVVMTDQTGKRAEVDLDARGRRDDGEASS